jgi:hypothetical protein
MNRGIFTTKVSLNVYEKKKHEELGTQVSRGRYVKVLTGSPITIKKEKFIEIQLCEDGYKGYLKFGKYLDDALILEAFTPNRVFSRAEILKSRSRNTRLSI